MAWFSRRCRIICARGRPRRTQRPLWPTAVGISGAIITGAAAGIGWAVAQAYAEMGANIALWYFTNTKGPERAEELAKQYNIQCKFTLVDGHEVISKAMTFR